MAVVFVQAVSNFMTAAFCAECAEELAEGAHQFSLTPTFVQAEGVCGRCGEEFQDEQA